MFCSDWHKNSAILLFEITFFSFSQYVSLSAEEIRKLWSNKLNKPSSYLWEGFNNRKILLR